MFVHAGRVEGRREEKRGMREGDGRELRGMGEEINGGEWRRGWRKERDGGRRQVEERREMEDGGRRGVEEEMDGWVERDGGKSMSMGSSDVVHLTCTLLLTSYH